MQKPILSSMSCSLDMWVQKKAHPRSYSTAWGFGAADGHRNPHALCAELQPHTTAMGWRNKLSLGLLTLLAAAREETGSSVQKPTDRERLFLLLKSSQGLGQMLMHQQPWGTAPSVLALQPCSGR